MKKSHRKAADRYAGVQVTFCEACNAAAAPHRACPSCGSYKGKTVISAE